MFRALPHISCTNHIFRALPHILCNIYFVHYSSLVHNLSSRPTGHPNGALEDTVLEKKQDATVANKPSCFQREDFNSAVYLNQTLSFHCPQPLLRSARLRSDVDYTGKFQRLCRRPKASIQPMSRLVSTDKRYNAAVCTS